MPACRFHSNPLHAVKKSLTRAYPGLQSPGRWLTVDLKKMLGFVAIIFVLFWVISSPSSASGSVNGIVGNLKSAGQSMVTFMNGVLG